MRGEENRRRHTHLGLFNGGLPGFLMSLTRSGKARLFLNSGLSMVIYLRYLISYFIRSLRQQRLA